ncbi:LmeA family phospholipid-binding protein [Nocardia rhizosphaerae]|uniref:DUF2993 domain-containing protein n=1 Tax=Nocardia rhizosphaerae TaxID=1691571 RepID=A0ABV8L0X9_9NOCA
MRTALILLVVGAIALVVGDRVAVTLVQNEIGRQVAAEYGLPQRPEVTIMGIPFLTKAVAGTYPEIDIAVGDWHSEDITVRDLDVALTDVTAAVSDALGGRGENLIADTATATAVVPYDVVRGFAPAGVESISHSPEGLRATGTFPVAGISVPATVFVTVAPTEGGIEVTPVSVQPAAGGPTIPLAVLRQTLTFVVPLRQLPLGARLTAITPTTDGLHVTAVANQVRLSDLP